MEDIFQEKTHFHSRSIFMPLCRGHKKLMLLNTVYNSWSTIFIWWMLCIILFCIVNCLINYLISSSLKILKIANIHCNFKQLPNRLLIFLYKASFTLVRAHTNWKGNRYLKCWHSKGQCLSRSVKLHWFITAWILAPKAQICSKQLFSTQTGYFQFG